MAIVAMVASVFGGRLAADQPHVSTATAFSFVFGQPGFIVVEGEDETVAVQNPRAAEGMVFYVTAILSAGCAGTAAVYYPPELQHPSTDAAWTPSTTNWTAGMLLPVVSRSMCDSCPAPEAPGALPWLATTRTRRRT